MLWTQQADGRIGKALHQEHCLEHCIALRLSSVTGAKLQSLYHVHRHVSSTMTYQLSQLENRLAVPLGGDCPQ